MNNIDFFSNLLLCVYNIYLWEFDNSGQLIKTNCPNENNIGTLLSVEHVNSIFEFAKEHARPSIHSGNYGTTWIIDSIRNDGKVEKIYTLGPAYIDSYPKNEIAQELEEQFISIKAKDNILEISQNIPILSFTKVLEYTAMMHYAINEERISIYDLHINTVNTNEKEDFEEETSVHGTYEAEQVMLRMVKEGDISIVEHLKKMATMGTIGKLANDYSEPLRQVKNTILVNIVLFSRAAIEGGLYPETSMALTDRYFQAVEAAKSFQEITDIAFTMQKDFVNRVHKIKINNNYSKVVQDTISYIDLHLEDEIQLEDIADHFAYAEYYLSKKFKKETNTTIKEFVRNKRLERASFYIQTTKLSISEISEKLHFPSQSYFTSVFKEKYGTTPSEFRKTS